MNEKLEITNDVLEISLYKLQSSFKPGDSARIKFCCTWGIAFPDSLEVFKTALDFRESKHLSVVI